MESVAMNSIWKETSGYGQWKNLWHLRHKKIEIAVKLWEGFFFSATSQATQGSTELLLVVFDSKTMNMVQTQTAQKQSHRRTSTLLGNLNAPKEPKDLLRDTPNQTAH